MSFTTKIIAGLALGVFTGLFLGELASPFSLGGDIFIGLLQMTVLPYIVVSLVVNLGRITWSESRGLLIAAATVLTLLLAIGVIVLFLVPLALPEWTTASFFSYSLVEQTKVIDFVALYIPSNPFASLANNMIPAAVLFSILLGVGISGVPDNNEILRNLNVVAEGLNRINKLVIKLTPIGVFAIAAGTAGTISIVELNRLQAYLVVYTALVLVLTLIVLPLLVSAVTPFRYKDLLTIPRDSLITIFATAKIIVLMPQLIENIKELFRRYDLQDEESDSAAGILLPLAYPFPNLGTYVILMFVPFAAWYLGRPLDLMEQLTLQGASLLSSFVAPIIGIPFLLDVMRIPSDIMELFVVSTVYTDRIRVVLGAMHLLALTIVVLAIRRGVFRFDLRRLAVAGGVSILALGIALIGVRSLLGYSLKDSYTGDQALTEMRWMERSQDAAVFRDTLPPADPQVGARGRMATIEDRRTIRVGFMADSLPFAFTNEKAEITGFDIELAHHLAQDLEVNLELVLIDIDAVNTLFETGQIDIVMSGLAMTPNRIRSWVFAGSALDLTLALLVPDHNRNTMSEFETLREIPDLRLGIVQVDPAFSRRLQNALPKARFEQIRSPRAFLRGQRSDLDGVVYSAEGGSAWTLIYPSYSVVIPEPRITRVPTGYPVPHGDAEWSRYVGTWIELKKKDGTVDALFDHWIRGKGAEQSEPRWSIVRNVLGWVD